MTISYNWVHDYLPVHLEPDQLSKILTSVGLEVESMERYESIKGALKGLIVGEVLSCLPHPNADKLKLTIVDIHEAQPLQIVCGAHNVAAGQKVIVARVGTTIYPVKGEAVTLKVAKIRGVESEGMICAEDEIGLGEDHSGIVVLSQHTPTGSSAAEYYNIESDWIYEIGLTPNRMDAMSHLGVAKDVCAYLSHHENRKLESVSPLKKDVKPAGETLPFKVIIENNTACRRYSGVTLTGITIKESPEWLKQKLTSIGQRPINNIVDLTNFILHETGQPLHAFDADKVKGNQVLVKNLPAGTTFFTLDEKERKLAADDLMICNGLSEPMCIAGVFGGLTSGITPTTKNIFIESAWFNPVDIRKTSVRHGLRTDAATRFEKNVDISNTVAVLKRAALLAEEIAGGTISSSILDVYPEPTEKQRVKLQYAFLKKVSGKDYDPKTVGKILTALGFELLSEQPEAIEVAVPFSNPDIHLPADLVEEIMRIDGYDNIVIPDSITITPSISNGNAANAFRDKIAATLVGAGCYEIFTNSITNSAYFGEEEILQGVRLLNNLSAVHNIMRPSMLETGLEAVAYNLNRKAQHLQFFEFGKTYSSHGTGNYQEKEHLCLYISGNVKPHAWNQPAIEGDFFYVKGLVHQLLQATGKQQVMFETKNHARIENCFSIIVEGTSIGLTGSVHKSVLNRFDIKQRVWFIDLYWQPLKHFFESGRIIVSELPKQLSVNRDLAMVVSQTLPYGKVEAAIRNIHLEKLQKVELFDVFKSEKLGKDKKSIAVSLTFLDESKTLTDKEIESMVNTIMQTLEKDLDAEIRKQ